MATVTTTTVANPLIYPSQSTIERVRSGDLWVIVAASTANTYELWRSQNAGASWTLALSTVRANVVEVGSIQCLRAPLNQLVWIYRTYESGQDRVYIRTISDLGATLAWNPELLITSVTAASAGDIFTGVDIANVTTSSHYVVCAIGSRLIGTSNIGVSIVVAWGPSLRSLKVDGSRINGPFYWVAPGTGRVTPSIEVEHTGDGHSTSTPHVWVAWGRTNAYLAKLSWTGAGWSTPTSPVQLNPITLTPAQDSIAARWDGNRFCTAVPDPSATSVVTVFERNRSNSTTTIRQTPTHPTGVVRNCTLGYNSVTGDLRVFAVGTSTAVLYSVDYVRATGLWSSWVIAVATAILGTNVNNYSVRRSTNGRYEILTAHAGSPNTIAHAAQSLSYTPNVPVWDSSAMQLTSGAAYDVNTPLTLDWVFSDPDPADTQSAYAISRQIGAGALNYWRASDSTWQVAEVQNTSGSTALVLPAPWGAGSDAATTFKAKVWDSANLPSGYSDGFAVLPSTVVNPAITAPTPAQVLTADSVTLTWTAAEQTAWRARLWTLGIADTYASRSNSSSWGTPEYNVGGAAWALTGTAADFNVASNVATVAHTALNALHTALADTGSSDHRVRADISFNVATPTGAAINQWIACRAADASNNYVAQLQVSTAGVVSLTISKRIAGSLTSVGATAVNVGAAHASGEVWRIVLDCTGSTLSAMAWKPATQAEPQGWQVQVFNETSLTAGTKAGVVSRIETGNTNTLPITFTVDNVYAATVLAYDTGWLSTNVQTLQLPVRLPDLSAWLLGVATRNAEQLPGSEQLVHVTVDFVEPAPATVVATPDPSNGLINVAITNPTPVGAQPPIADQDLYARPNLAGANLLTNPGFEVNTTGWQGAGGATLTRSTVQAHTGTAAGLLTPDGVSASPRVECSTGQRPVAAVGQSWTVDGWLRPTTANKPIQIGIEWFDGGGSLLSTSTLQVAAIAGAWLYLSWAAVAPASTATVAAMVAVVSTPAAGDTTHLDDMRLRLTDTTTGTRVGTGVASGATVADWHAVHGVDYEYRTLTRATNGTSTYGPWTA